MSYETYVYVVSEIQRYLAVFDAPTRHFLYGVAIALTIVSLIFSYYMVKISLNFAIELVKTSFTLVSTLVKGVVDTVRPRRVAYVATPVLPPQAPSSLEN